MAVHPENDIAARYNITDGSEYDLSSSINTEIVNPSYLMSDKRPNVDWADEYMKIRFSNQYLVYKIKPIWLLLDRLSQMTFVLISLVIIILALYWQISVAMWYNMGCFIGLCLALAINLYNVREKDRALYLGKTSLNMEEVVRFWKEYKKIINKT